jgi:hypothetical protein
MPKSPKTWAEKADQEKGNENGTGGEPTKVLTSVDATRLMHENEEFSRDLRANPEKYQEMFNLSDSAVAMLKRLGDADVKRIRELVEKDKQGFAVAMGALEELLTRKIKKLHDPGEDNVTSQLMAYHPPGPYKEN